MTLQELKKMARWGIAKWCDKLPQDGETMIELIGVESRYIITPIPAETVVTMLLDNKKKTKRHKVKGKLK